MLVIQFIRNPRPSRPLLAAVFCLAATQPLLAQGTQADYDRANALPSLTADKVTRSVVEPHWFGGGDRFWYRIDQGAGAGRFILVDAVKGERRPAFDHEALAKLLAATTGRPHSADRLPLDSLNFDPAGPVYFQSEGKAFRYDPAADKLTEAKPPAKPGDPKPPEPKPIYAPPQGATSPDGKWTASVRDYNVQLRAPRGPATPLSFEGVVGDEYGGPIFWAPDSSRFVVFRTAAGDDRKVNLIESSPRDRLQPRLITIPYLKPGDRIPSAKPHLFDVVRRQEIPVSDAIFPNPWELETVRWAPNSSHFTFVYNQRGHQVLRLIAVDAATGSARAVVDDQSRTFIDYAHKQFVHHLDAAAEVVWMSERDGWNHLHLVNANDGKIKNLITRGDWVVRGVDRVDDEKRQVWFRAGGVDPAQDPYYIHYCRCNLDGGGFIDLTPGDGTHKVTFSPDARFLIDVYSRVDLPPVTELRSVADGRLICELERADWSALLKTGWRPPERFVAKGRDDKTDIYGVIYRPTNFDPARKYPVVEHIYAGPQDSYVPKEFAPFHRPQALAELGFVVAEIDGMGTSNRSKSFHDVCWKNLADAGFPDRIRWLQAAAKRDPALDLSRVGIYGGSAGGQNALGAMLFHGDFYRSAAADCGCHDNRMDKIWWNELWMGWPVGPHYAEQSNVTNAHKLKGKLLLTVGELDRNVDPSSTLQVVNALIKADKDFELVVVPGADHGGRGRYTERRRRDFFVRTLLGVEPRRP